jgi:hypothetical protein
MKWSLLISPLMSALPTWDNEYRLLHDYYSLVQKFPNLGSWGLFDGLHFKSQNIKIDWRQCTTLPTALPHMNGHSKCFCIITCLYSVQCHLRRTVQTTINNEGFFVTGSFYKNFYIFVNLVKWILLMISSVYFCTCKCTSIHITINKIT